MFLLLLSPDVPALKFCVNAKAQQQDYQTKATQVSSPERERERWREMDLERVLTAALLSTRRLSKSLSSSKGSRTGNSANNKELKVLTLLQTVP